MERIKRHLVTSIMATIAIFLFILPFFWFKPGEMDLGGDSSRLYFYDPLAYLQNYALYSISPSSFGGENIGYYMIPFVFLLFCLKLFFYSPTILIAFFHGLSLSVAFIFIYLIVKDLLGSKEKEKKIIFESSAIISGLVYVLSQTAIQGWDKVLVTHNQVFLNPLMFFLFLRYFKTTKILYLLVALLITFIFSPNFSFAAAPPFFAFYPLSMLFLMLYRVVILKKVIIWKHITFAIIAFILLQSFHLIPQIISAFSPGSSFNTTIFTNEGKLDRGLGYFSAIAPDIKVSLNLMNLPQMTQITVWFYIAIIFPVTIVLGFLFNRTKTLLLTAAFFLCILFFASANITHIGLELYKILFYIPGFSMFRNFYGQWGYTLLFFYTILFGQSLALVLFAIKEIRKYALCLLLLLFLILPAIPFFNGSLINKDLWLSNNLKIFMKMDPNYEQAISYIKSLPIDAKVLTLPLTDPGYQIVLGTNNGAYQGPSTISYLGGKKDFAGTVELGAFQKNFLTASKRGDYQELNRILTLLGVKYVFYNADPFVYEKGFPTFPYQYGKDNLPVDQGEYKNYIKNMHLVLKKQFGKNIFVYERKDGDSLPNIYVSTGNELLNKNFVDFPEFSETDKIDTRRVYIDSNLYGHDRVIKDTLLNADTNLQFEEFFIRRPDSQIPPAFISQKLDSFAYPLVVEKEKNSLKRQKYINDDYIDRTVFYADKRLGEMERWSADLTLLGNVSNIATLDKVWKEPGLSEPERINEYNTWEIGMVRYKRTMSTLIQQISRSNESLYSTTVNKLYLKKILLGQEDKLNNIIINSKRSEKEKVYLMKLAQDMNDDLLASLNIAVPQFSSLKIELNNPSTGNYDLFIENKDLENFSNWKLTIGNKEYQEKISDKKDWEEVENIPLRGGKIRMELNVKVDDYPNLISDTEWENLEKKYIDATLLQYEIVNNTFSNTDGLVREIKHWDPNAIYVVSFDYNSFGKEFALKLNEKSGMQVNEISNNKLRSTDWEKFQTVIHSSDKAQIAYIQIVKNKGYMTDLLERDKGNQTKLEIKNLSVIKIPNPQIVLKKKSDKKTTAVMPKISFKKINQTKYEIQIKDAETPYTLVFLNQFNANWNLYEIKEKSDLGDIVANYYNGQIKEGTPLRQLADANPFETFGKQTVAKDKHFQVNDFANAWYVEPKDVGYKKDYTLLLEFKTQKIFYISEIITGLGLIILSIAFIYSLKKYEKKNN